MEREFGVIYFWLRDLGEGTLKPYIGQPNRHYDDVWEQITKSRYRAQKGQAARESFFGVLLVPEKLTTHIERLLIWHNVPDATKAGKNVITPHIDNLRIDNLSDEGRKAAEAWLNKNFPGWQEFFDFKNAVIAE